MRTIRIAVFLSAFCAGAPGSPLTALERQRLIAHMEMTASWLSDEVAGLSQPQLHFRRLPGTWSILELLNHLVVAGPIYWLDLQKAMKASPVTGKSAMSDAQILWYGIDRTQREKAVAPEAPTPQLRDVRSGLDTLRRLHTDILRYVRTTDDDLRGHVVERQQCDAYQWLLLISAHQQRHILQIRELKSDAKFPQK